MPLIRSGAPVVACLLSLACAAAPTQGAGPAARPAPAAAGAAGAADSLVSAPVTNVGYDVLFDRGTAPRNVMRVAMTFDVAGPAPVLLSLPAWTPGSYELGNFARYVIDFAAAAAPPAGAVDDRAALFGGAGAGAPLAWEKADHDTWRVRPTRAGRVLVTFEVLADSLDNAIAWSTADFLMFNGTTAFMYAEGRPLDFAARVRVHTERDWLVATGMPAEAPGAAGAAGGDAARRYAAGSYHDLVDFPFFVGRFALDSMQVAGRWTRLATYPTGSVTGARRARAWDWLTRVIPPQVAVFGDVPWEHYTLLQIADSTFPAISGLEHQNSHLNIINALALDDPFIPSLYAHEVFHAWNVKRLRPAELVPYRYDRPQPTTLLWVSEGLTDYYADLSTVRGGVVDSAGFFEATASKIQEVSATAPVALEDASLSTWVGPVNGTAMIYYPKGSLAGLMLDIIIRDATDNRASLDQVMRAMYETTARRGTGFTGEEWWAAVTRAANGRDFGDFDRRFIDGRDPYPMAEMLPLAGMRLLSDTVRAPQVGIYTLVDTGGVRVTGVEPGGAAATAGVQPGDYLLSVGDIPVRDAEFAQRFRAKYARAAGGPLPLKVRRGAREISLSATVRLVPVRVSFAIVADPAAGEKARRIRNGILRGTVER